MEEINKTKLSYKIKPITDNDIPAVISLLKNSFFHDEPLNASVGLTEENGSVTKLEEFCKTYLLTGELVSLLELHVKQYYEQNAY